MQRIPVTGETVNGGELFACLLFDNCVRLAFGRSVDSARSTTVGTLLAPAEPTGTAHKSRGFVVEDFFAGGFVFGDATADDRGCFAFVLDFYELGVGDESCFGWDGEGADFEVLFAVEEHVH